MSRIRANNIVNGAGTGAPTFPNGVVINGISTITANVQLNTSELTIGTGTTISNLSDNEFRVLTNGSERVRVTSDGNVGIGTTNPNAAYKLHVSDVGGTIALHNATQSNTIRYANTNTTAEWSAGTSRPGLTNAGDYYSITQYGTDGTWRERFTLDSSGNTTIGQYTPPPTNDAISSQTLNFIGGGYNTSTGSTEVGTKLQSQHAYWTGNYSGTFGQTYPDFKILIKNSDNATYDEKFAFSGNGVMRLISGGGINFNNYGTGTDITSNLLDDYEEGTWTPELRFGGNTTGISYQWRGGIYTRVGRLVTCYGAFNLTSKGTATGIASIYELPFTATDLVANTTIEGGMTSIYQNNLSGTIYGPLFGAVINNNSYFEMYRISSTSGALSNMTASNFTDTTLLRFTVVYTAV